MQIFLNLKVVFLLIFEYDNLVHISYDNRLVYSSSYCFTA
ncbi:hypothetical protein HNQ54_002895 [Anaerocolumna cellulosilytica]|nr:hypothetical protein [Anaerocolumna cellulosilytica]